MVKIENCSLPHSVTWTR